MKKILIFIFLSTISLLVYASGLGPWKSTIWSEYNPLWGICFDFNEPLKVKDGATVEVMHNGDMLYSFPLLVRNDQLINGGKWYGCVYADYEGSLYLPKGEAYQIVIEEDLIQNRDDPSKSNDRIVYDLNVPAFLQTGTPDFDFNNPVKELTGIGMAYSVPGTIAYENGIVLLYREGVFIRSYPVEGFYDPGEWGLGEARCNFGRLLQFEKNVRYTMVIPEGSVGAVHRPDIMNREEIVEFEGACANLPAPEPFRMSITKDSMFYNRYKVSFHYNEPIQLLPKAIIQLFDEEGRLINEAISYLEENNHEVLLNAEFRLASDISEIKGYFVIPEGTVVFSEGNMVVNHENRIDLSPSIVNETITTKPKIEYDEDYIHVKGCTVGSRISLTSMDGRMMGAYDAYSEEMSIPAPPSGIYVITVDNFRQKIHIK